jgi:hypothetical protein
MSSQVGETTVAMMSAASANSRPRSSQVPKRRQMAFRAPCEADGDAATGIRRSIAARPGGLVEELFH